MAAAAPVESEDLKQFKAILKQAKVQDDVVVWLTADKGIECVDDYLNYFAKAFA